MKVKKTNKKKTARINKPEPDPIQKEEDSNDSSSDDDDVPQAADPVKVNDTIISEMEVGENSSGDEAEEPKAKTSKKSKEKPTRGVKPEEDEEPKKLAYDKSEEPRTVFCGNIPNGPNVNETRIKDLFGEYGTVKSVRFRSEIGKILFSKKMKKDTKNFNAYVVFEKEEDAKSSIKLNGFKLLDNHLRVNMANNKRDAFSNKGTIFVGNLPFDSLESEIHEYFSQVGNIEYCRKIANKGIAYVCFSKGVNISTALKLNDQPFKGRKLRISRCESRDKQDKKKLYKKDEKTGKRIKLRVKKGSKINEEIFMRGKSNNNPIVKKIKSTQSAKYNKFTEKNQLSKKELFRRGGKMDQNQREDNREKGTKKKKFFGSKVDGIDKAKSKKSKVSKSLKQQKVIAKKLKSAASRVTSASK
jgi:nucleolar protein 12